MWLGLPYSERYGSNFQATFSHGSPNIKRAKTPLIDAFARRGMGADGLADVYRIRPNVNGRHHLGNHVANMRTAHAITDDLAETMRFTLLPYRLPASMALLCCQFAIAV